MQFFKKSLMELHQAQQGKVSDKWQLFLLTYDRIFQSYRDRAIKLLEIGVQNGGSLEVWSKYFSKAESILGCDIRTECGALKFSNRRIQVVVGDAAGQPTYKKITATSSQFDVVIDDGSHVSDDILKAFFIYFPLVSPGGVYVIEDTHTLYWERYQGGLSKPSSAKELFKKLTDVVNFEHWEEGTTIADYLLIQDKSTDIKFIEEGWVESIEFCNSLIIVRKANNANHNKLGKRIIVGTIADVEPESLKVQHATNNKQQ
jgi:cephalosporin hydroxylase